MNKISSIGAAPTLPRLFPSTVPLGKPVPELAGSVAVIMRTKDRPLLLHRALASVLCQTSPNWHLYLVNDGGNREQLEDLLVDYDSAFGNRLTVVHHATSQGMENASNAGLSLGREEFVAVHDDDDSWHPEFLEATTAFLSAPANEHCVGVVTGCTQVTERLDDDDIEEIDRTVRRSNRTLVDLPALLVENRFPPICLLFRRAAVERIGPFNGALPVLGDWEFNIRLLLLGEIDFLDRNLANYHLRVRGSGAAYGNTVVDGQAQQQRQNILLRNSILRNAIAEQPATLGTVQAVLFAQSQAMQDGVPKAPPTEITGRLDTLNGWLEAINGKQEEIKWEQQAIRGELAAIGGKLKTIQERMEVIEAGVRDIGIVASWLRKLLRPMHWAWLRLLPLRRLIARIRGRR
ncbi:Glycosyltransferase [Rhodovastum atsumiense]|nr:glycosyltransferase [Rhodovastum atsumiense]CAH2601897.1 Glycosyltransferase [Rhodovastum atsumiense]